MLVRFSGQTLVISYEGASWGCFEVTDRSDGLFEATDISDGSLEVTDRSDGCVEATHRVRLGPIH